MRHIRIFITFLLLCTSVYSISPKNFRGENQKENSSKYSIELLNKADKLFLEKNYPIAIETYKNALNINDVDKPPILKKVALSYSALNNVDESLQYIEKYLISDFDVSVLKDVGFDSIRQTQEFTQVSEKYAVKYSIWSFMYLYVALIGFYVALMIHFNKKIDFIAKLLISIFIFIHSSFILHICLSITNLQYRFPHSFAMSTSFSFLYGPLLYFYFKRITQQYEFKRKDLLHLIPTIFFVLYMIPIYALSAEDKLGLMMHRIANGRSFGDIATIVLKLTSLIVYGYFIRKVYLVAKTNKNTSKVNHAWRKNIFGIHIMYVFCYAAYGFLLGNNITSGLFFHLQVISMAFMVMYIGYSASVQPDVFSGIYSFEKGLFFKYKKSGLTNSLSTELKDNLIYLFDHEKIYKVNDLSLDIIADRLNTTRHNASQVINEHFNINFHELVNKYRIHEAKSILDTDSLHNLNIIDIAYEVGYNNKVTFNKAFKKDTDLTPSEYQRTSLRVKV